MPDFDESLVNIPHTLLEHFGIAHDKGIIHSLLNDITGSSQVVLLLVDGLGYNLLNKQDNYLTRINKKSGIKLKTTFPSSTPPAVTSLMTGLTPKEHGLLEWNLYIEELGIILETFPYKRADATIDDSVVSMKDPSFLYDGITIFEKLAENSITSYYFVAEPNQSSPYTKATSKGAIIKSFSSFSDLSHQLIEEINQNSENGNSAYYYVHWGEIDKAAHLNGPNSKEVKFEIDLLSNELEHNFFNKLSINARQNTALVLTSDHGHVSVEPHHAVYLNDYPQITHHFKRTSTGVTILPSGGARSVFLSIEDKMVETVVRFINTTLHEIADAVVLDDYSIRKLFGAGKPNPKFYSRVGNVLILPKAGQTVWYKYTVNKELAEKGDHGGLSQDEMYIPCVVLRSDI